MQKAAFSIINYRFDKVSINLSNHKSNDLCLDFDTKGLYDKNNSTFELIFSIKVFNENSIENPFVEVQCNGIFKFDNNTAFGEIPDFFYRNCIAILFPFLRAYISMITIQSNVPGIILPTLNLTSLEDKLKHNTSLK